MRFLVYTRDAQYQTCFAGFDKLLTHHSCMLETRDIYVYTSDVYTLAYVMHQSFVEL